MKEDQTGCLLVVAQIANPFITGWFAWDITHPHSFTGAIGFLIVWGVFGFIGNLIVMGIISTISKN